MSLFDNRQAVNLRTCEQMVESVLAQFGEGAGLTRLPLNEIGPAWTLSCSAVQLSVFLRRSSSSEENYIHIVAPVFRPPAEADAALWQHLLALNASELTGGAFGLREGEVVIAADRCTQGLDRVEVEDMIRRICDHAARYDDLLTQRFGGTRHRDLPQAPLRSSR